MRLTAPRTYFVRCVVDVAQKPRLAELRPAHLAHIGANREVVVYGGVVAEPDTPPDEIILVLAVPSAEDAEALVKADPYAQAYESVHIAEFQQRIPPP